MKLNSIGRGVLIAGLCAGIFACGGGGDDSGGGSSRDTGQACGLVGLQNKILNGMSCDNSGGSAIVRVMTAVAGGSTPICTGSLVAPDTVITAAHCYTGAQQGIFIGDKETGVYVSASRLLIAPGAHADGATQRIFNDVMLMKLSRSVPLPVMPILLSRPVQTGESGFVYGYGSQESGEGSSTSDFLTLEAGVMEVASVTENHIFVVFGGDGVNVCHGDSGGPLVVEVNGQPALAGVVSVGSNAQCMPGDVTSFSNLQQADVLAWLERWVPNAYVRSL